MGKIIFSHTPDRDFCSYYPPVPDLGKDKKQTAARRPQAGRTSIRDLRVIFTAPFQKHLYKLPLCTLSLLILH